MKIYSKTKREFISDILTNSIDSVVVREVGQNFGESQLRSIRESMNYMERIIQDPDIPDNSGISIEYKIPASAMRIDFVITGLDDNGNKNVILIELKQ